MTMIANHFATSESNLEAEGHFPLKESQSESSVPTRREDVQEIEEYAHPT